MRLLENMLDWVHDGFNRSPEGRTAIYLTSNDSSLRVGLADGVLSFSQAVGDGLGMGLDGLSIGQVFASIDAAYPGQARLVADLAARPARMLLAPRRYLDPVSGDFVYVFGAYQSLLYGLLDVYSLALEAVGTDVQAMLAQSYLHSATDIWLDEWGGYLGVARLLGEADGDYLNRIIAVIIQPKCNNVALAMAIAQNFGLNEVTVTDIDAKQGFFTVNMPFDLLGGDTPTLLANAVTVLVNQLKAAGTVLDSVYLEPTGGTLAEAVPYSAAGDAIALSVYHWHYFNGASAFNGAIQFQPTLTMEKL